MVNRCVNGQMCSPDNAFFLTLNCSVKYMANKSYIAIFSYLGKVRDVQFWKVVIIEERKRGF